MTKWMVTGGAGYIGAHVARKLLESGREVVVVDDLSTGFESFVPPEAAFVPRRIHDLTADDLRGIDGVVHLAALKYAGLSVQEPLRFYRNNVDGMAALLETMIGADVNRLVYSGSCSVYGTPAAEHVDEDTPTGPESPYGETKLLGEWLARDVAAVHPLRYTSLRYFNVVGSAYAEVYDASPHNLFPIVFRAIDAGVPPKVHGDDYPTPDGSCIRDYIHVGDLADAHVLAADRLDRGDALPHAYNIGTGTGASVLQVVDAVRRTLDIALPVDIGPRRAGDPARIIADGTRARDELGWTPTADLDDMVRDAWASWRTADDHDPH
jgi:UDP-glucose 4-epimerase